MSSASESAQPLTDRLGRRRSRVTLPDFRKGTKPANAGRRLPAEALKEDELERLMFAISRTSATGKRNRAMVWLMYLGLKVHHLEALETRHYAPDANSIEIPSKATRGKPMVIHLDRTGRELMAEWWDTRKRLRISPSRPLFCTIAKGSGNAPVKGPYLRTMLKRAADFAEIHRRVTPQGLVLTGKEHRGEGSLSFEAQLQAYVNTSIRQRYPTAHAKWRGAQTLFVQDPISHATNIGNGCREALQAYANRLTEEYPDSEFDATAASTTKIRQVLASQDLGSDTLTKHIEAVVAYWSSVNVLAQREVHKDQVAGIEDSRRLIFHTMLVMYEVDQILAGIT